jgi:hypothetical protein
MVVAGLSHCNENHRAMITLHCVPHNKKITQFISPPVLLLKKKLFIIAPRAAALRLSEREITQRRRMSTAELCAFGSIAILITPRHADVDLLFMLFGSPNLIMWCTLVDASAIGRCATGRSIDHSNLQQFIPHTVT